jgi:predicted MPP superfamily phosphohydrolase
VSIYAFIYIAAVSLLAVILTIYDKNAAKKNAWRVKERTLLLVSAFGGSAAMLIAMLTVRHKTQRKKFMFGIPLILTIQIAIIVFALNLSLSVSYYEIESDKINGEIKLILVTDLHSCDYGDGQIELINAIETERPDAVLLVGDIYDDGLPPENTTEFIQYLSGKYPCYYVSGNHEFWSRQADEYKSILESYGVKVLEGTSEILKVGGDRIRISGIDDPDTDRYPSRSIPYSEQIIYLNDEKKHNELFTILLSHRPERINELLPLNSDLVLSGHAHGGQWRLPIILENGLLSPNQGLFPKYTNGEYIFGNTTLLVSRGLAKESTRLIPRIFNRPEIVVITLK